VLAHPAIVLVAIAIMFAMFMLRELAQRVHHGGGLFQGQFPVRHALSEAPFNGLEILGDRQAKRQHHQRASKDASLQPSRTRPGVFVDDHSEPPLKESAAVYLACHCRRADHRGCNAFYCRQK
jgi:hypothetical protein